VRIRVIYKVNQAEDGIHMLVVAPQGYVNIYSTRRFGSRGEARVGSRRKGGRGVNPPEAWPLHNIASTDIVWCMAFKGGVGRGACIAQW